VKDGKCEADYVARSRIRRSPQPVLDTSDASCFAGEKSKWGARTASRRIAYFRPLIVVFQMRWEATRRSPPGIRDGTPAC
jgi:hypothetical protein